jgi:hypothetical protein
MFEIEYLLESNSDANSLATHRSNVNEFLLAQELKKLAGHTSKKVGSSYFLKTGGTPSSSFIAIKD